MIILGIEKVRTRRLIVVDQQLIVLLADPFLDDDLSGSTELRECDFGFLDVVAYDCVLEHVIQDESDVALSSCRFSRPHTTDAEDGPGGSRSDHFSIIGNGKRCIEWMGEHE